MSNSSLTSGARPPAANDAEQAPIRIQQDAILSTSLSDFGTSGVVVEVDPDEAEALGAFEETALTEADAWESNADLGDALEGHGHGVE
ncbi:hypothetical protein M5E06_15215 [Azospirillum sp. A1-3]|uniref:hypothetical protein n=1 Tax=Azospirillum sp. A1-3 TaxID=185874 RepID=UPI00207759EA|nr:hypothetical protein [Azospirillum sp. A1-3]MCM8735508.1 hypothetical protein [Azospirillum sp. A1-3]